MYYNVLEAYEETRELAGRIHALHVSSGTASPHCILCDQPFPCETVQTAMTIEGITLVPMRMLRDEPSSMTREEWVTQSLQQISIALGEMIDHRSEHHLEVFEQLMHLHGLPRITQTARSWTGYSELAIGLIHPHHREPIPLWELRADLIAPSLRVKVWLEPAETSVTRPFLVDIACAAMQPVEACQLIDWWRAPGMAATATVTQELPPNGALIAEVVRTLVGATVEVAESAAAGLDWDVWSEDLD